MTRVGLQVNLERVIEETRLVVKGKKGLRDAVRVGVYQVGKRVFAAIDSTTAYEVKDGNLVQLSQEEYTKYIRPEYILQASYEFKVLSDKDLNTLLGFFNELAKE
jgi:hypothetical protein